MTIFTNTAQEAYNQLLANSSNSLNGTWEITENNYLSITGQSNGSIAMFSTLGALGDFTLEWTSKQLGGSYIHSNLCPILRYTPEDLGIEGGGYNYAMILYLCSYRSTSPTGTFFLRYDDENTSKEYPTGTVNIDVNSTHSFKLVRSGSTLTFYEDNVLITTTTNLSSKPLYLGWYLWFGGLNSSYQTNFVLQNYRLEGVLGSIKNYLNKPGLAEVWQNIKNYISSALSSKADKTTVNAHTSDSTIHVTQSDKDKWDSISTDNFATKTELATKSDTSHTHDERYYTESEVDTKLATKQDSGNYVTTDTDQTISATKTFINNSKLIFFTERLALITQPKNSNNGVIGLDILTQDNSKPVRIGCWDSDKQLDTTKGFVSWSLANTNSIQNNNFNAGNSFYTLYQVINSDGSITRNGDVYYQHSATDEYFCIRPGRNYGNHGLTVRVGAVINVTPRTTNTMSLGHSGLLWSTVYSATSTINTSDLRQKQQIKPIDDNLLNAWENVSPVQYKFNDSVESKGDNARLHTGYIAQDIDQACKDQGVNASEYGLFCYDKWEAEEARYMEEQEEYQDGEEEVTEEYVDDVTGETKTRTVTKPIMKTRTKKTLEQEARPAGDSYSLRYEEALVVECAYLRKQLKLLSDRLEKLERNE